MAKCKKKIIFFLPVPIPIAAVLVSNRNNRGNILLQFWSGNAAIAWPIVVVKNRNNRLNRRNKPLNNRNNKQLFY